MRVRCEDAVLVTRISEGALPAGIEIFAANGGSLLAGAVEGGLLWAKVGVGILPHHAITIRMLSPRPGQGGMLWGRGTGGPQGLVHFDACRSYDSYPPVLKPDGLGYAGGFIVRGPSCVELQVTGSGHSDIFRLSIRAKRSDPTPRRR